MQLLLLIKKKRLTGISFLLLALACFMQIGWQQNEKGQQWSWWRTKWNKPADCPPGWLQAGTSGIADPEQSLISWCLLKQCTREQSAFQTKNRRLAPNKISRTLQEQIPPLHRPNPPSTLGLTNGLSQPHPPAFSTVYTHRRRDRVERGNLEKEVGDKGCPKGLTP